VVVLEEKLRQRLLGLVGLARPHEVLEWGTFGPTAFTAFLRRHGLFDHALPVEVLYPVHWTKTELYFATPDAVTPLLTEATIAVHLGNRIIDTKIGRDREPPSGSWLANMCRRYNVMIPERSVSVV
jgi:Alpha 1,4-glycosyltransferase conserved region